MIAAKSWNLPARRRLFFEKYARANGFDPLKPEHWYSQSKNKIKLTKVIIIIIIITDQLYFVYL